MIEEQVKINAESQFQMAVGMMLESVGDKSPIVRETVIASIRKLAEKHPNQVLNCCCNFCKKSMKPSGQQIASVLSIMETICIDFIVDVDGDTILTIIEFAMESMLANPGYDPLVQMPASGVLVALGRKHHIQVIDSLMKKIESGVLPHYMIPHTLGALASTNAYGVIPYLKNILSLFLPLFGGLKQDSLKQAFSYAIESFCEALIEYTSNIDQTPDNTITIENFQTEIGMAYDVLFSSWLLSRESKVVNSVLNALSSIFLILTPEKINQQSQKIIVTLLNLYKKQVDPYYITKALGAIIQRASNVNGTVLEPLINNIFQALADLICISPDYAQPDSLRSHSEALRCYECFALHFTDHTIDQLINQLKNNNEKERIKGLLVITHLTSYSTEHAIQRRFKDIMKYLNEMLNDSSMRVKKTLMKIIVAFACRGVLLNKEINQEGPEKFMKFILKLCCKQFIKNNEIDKQELFDIQKSADNTLVMLSTSVPELESTLWNLFMDCFLGPLYDEATVVLLRCLTHLASKKTLTENCEAAFIRCLTLISYPLPGFRGTYILNFLKNITLYTNEKYKFVWESKLLQLSKYLEQNYEIFNQIEWQDLVFDFLSIILDNINNEKFNEKLVLMARQQLEIYNNNRYINNGGDSIIIKQTEKQFLLKSLAIILCYINDKEMVIQTLDNILINVKLTDYQELDACAEAVGICSRTHLEIVLDKLSMIRKDILLKKSSKFLQFSFIKDQKHELGIERVRYVVISSYAEVCNEANTEKLLKVIESEILDFIVNELNNNNNNIKDFAIKKVCLKCIGNVADAMHPNRNTLHVRMLDRDKVLNLVSSQIHLHSGPEFIELFPIILPVITSLIRLPLPLECEQRLKLIKLCFDNIFNAAAIYCKINVDSSIDNNYYGDLKLVPFITSSFTKLNQLIKELLLENLSPSTLDEIITILELWLGRRKAEQRLPAIETLKILLETYLNNMKFAFDCPSKFGQSGSLLGKIIPRTTDPNKNIRKISIECLCLILCISSRYEGLMRDNDKILINSLQHIQQNIDNDDPKLLYNLTIDIANIICINLPNFQLIHFIDGLIDGLLDYENSSSYGCSIVLNIILKKKGGDLQNYCKLIMERIINQLNKINYSKTKSTTLKAILNLTIYHYKIILNILLNQQLPFDLAICDCWSILSTDYNLVQNLLDQFKKIIKQTPLYEIESNEIKIATLLPLQTICALYELLKNTQLKNIFRQEFSDIFAILLIVVASYIGTSFPTASSTTINNEKKEKYFIINNNRQGFKKLIPTKIALETFKLFLINCEYNQTANCLIEFTKIENYENNILLYLNVIECLVKEISIENSESLSWIVASLAPFIRAEFEPQRVAAVTFFSYLLKYRANDQNVLAENLLEMLLDVHNDQNYLVRKIALKALGFAVEYLNQELVSRHCHPILSVFMNSLDYNNISNESDVILEGMLSFSKLLTSLEGHKFGSFQVTAAVRLKPLFDQDDINLRTASIRLLGNLAQTISPDGNATDAFKEQVQGNLITLLLHLSDPDINVIKSCKFTLRKLAIFLDSPKVNSMIQEHLIDEANLHYSDFIRDLIKIMADEMQDLFNLLIMTNLAYLKSPWVEIRSNAALMVGLLYLNLNLDNRNRLNLDRVCDRLLRLLNDEEEDVRMRAVQAVAYLFIN